MTNQKSIAVLPLENLSSDPENEYFSDGMTEEIINALTTIKGLKVTARTSSFAYKNKRKDVRHIGNELGVSLVLEGSIRKSGDKVRITTQLIRTDNGFHIWSENFDRKLNDIFVLQDEISLLVADKIRENYGHLDIKEHLVESPTQNVEAYNLYLKGRYYQLKWNANDFHLAVKYYNQSIEEDRNFALPYFGAGLCYGIMASWKFMPYQEGIQKAKEYLSQGLALNQESHLSHFAKATIELWGKWNFKSGHIHLTKSIAYNPSFTDAEEGLAELYTAIGDFEKAMRHTKRILLINPFSPNHFYTKGNIEYLSGKYDLAINSMRSALKIDPDFSLAIEVIALCYILKQDEKKLEEYLDQSMVENPTACRALFKLMYPDSTFDFDLSNFDLSLVSREELIPWHLYLQVHLGNIGLAFEILEASIAEKSGQIINFQNDPFLSPLRSSDTYQQLIAKVFDPGLLPEVINLGDTESTSRKPLMTSDESDLLLKNLEQSMKVEKLYLDASLSLRTLAEKLDTHANKLSWLVNKQICQNFSDYVNTYRLMEFQKKAVIPENSHLTILGLAYESGFNSKSVFNTFFKKNTGLTPKEWVKEHRK